MRVDWNGSQSDSFTCSRCLRQGDPISPFLFVLCLETLGHSIKDVVDAGDGLPFSFGRGDSLKHSHMCSADDLILVDEASMNQVACIDSILHMLYSKSGQKVNFQKSQVFFSSNVSDVQSLSLSYALGGNITKDLGKYLGASMLHQRISKHSFTFMLDKMRKKLFGRKANTLSFAGRVILAQASSQTSLVMLFSPPLSLLMSKRLKKFIGILSGAPQ